MSTLLAEGLLSLFDRLLLELRPNIDDVVEWVRDAATPPMNLEFKATDNGVYTGIVVLERGRAILMLAIRTQAPAAPLTPPARQEPVRYEPRYEPQRYEQPARARNLFDDEDPGDGWPPNDPFLPRR